MRFKLGVGLAGLLVALVAAVGVITVTLRGENTRETVYRISACMRAAELNPDPADVAECERLRRRIDETRALDDACIVQRKTLKPRWYEVVTRCPRTDP